MTSESNPRGVLEIREPIYEEYFNSDRVLLDFTDTGTPSNDCSSGYLKQTLSNETASTVLILDNDTTKNVVWRKWGDYTVKFRYMVESGATCDPFIQGRDDGGNLVFSIDLASTTFTFNDEDDTSIGTKTGVQFYRWYDIKIQQDGTKIEAWVDGTSVGSDTNQSRDLYDIQFGSIAAKTITHRFDNLLVYRIKQTHDNTGSSDIGLNVENNIVDRTDSFRANLTADVINPIQFIENEQDDYRVHTVDQSQTTTDTLSIIDSSEADSSYDVYAQIFKPTKSTMSKVGLKLRKQGSPDGNILVALYKAYSDTIIRFDGLVTKRTYACSNIDGDFSEHEIKLSYNELDVSQYYAIVVHHDGSGGTDPDATNYIELGRNSAGGYANGNARVSTDSGWTFSTETGDFYFKTYYPTASTFDLAVRADVRNILELSVYDEDDNLLFTTGTIT